MSESSEINRVLAAIDALGTYLAGQDLEGTMEVLADSPDLAVIPSEGVHAHRGRLEVESFFRRIYAGPKRYAWRWQDRWVSIEASCASFVALGVESVEVDGGQPREIPYCLTGTLIQRQGSWRFLLLHGSEAAAIAAPSSDIRER